nr:MAG TPA_asm: hypothetical protein [Caudoviricetes sp.]
MCTPFCVSFPAALIKVIFSLSDIFQSSLSYFVLGGIYLCYMYIVPWFDFLSTDIF